MKYIKHFEKNKIPKFKEGDIIVAINSQTIGQYKWILKDSKYIVLSATEYGGIKIQLLHPLTLEIDMSEEPIFRFYDNNFISLEEWKLMQNQKKFNL